MLAERRRALVALLAAPWVLWALVRVLGFDTGDPLVAAMAFTPYAAATALLPVAVALVAREWAIAAVAAVALAALVVVLVPRALDGPRLARDAPPADRRLVVMSINLRFGEADARSVMARVRRDRVDVLALLELSRSAVARLDRAGARALLPHRVLAPGTSRRGIGIMARRPLTALGAPDPESGRVEAALALPGGRALRVAAVHPIPPRTVASARQWRTALRALPGAAAGHVPHVLLGDFNATLDNRELRRLLGRGYVDAADATGQGLRPTFPSGRAIPPIAIDHVLFSRSLRVHALSVHDIRHSDHRALVAELVLAPG